MKKLILLVTIFFSLLADETGELSFYLMKDGKPLAQQEISLYKLDKQKSLKTKAGSFTTDADGYLSAVLPSGDYQLQAIAKEGTDVQAFVRKNFVIKAGKESQIIISLEADNKVAFEDQEAPKVDSAVKEDLNVTKEQGTLMLTLRSAEDQKPIAEARIFVKGASIDVKTDAKGFLSLDLPEGEQTLSIIHSDFSSQTIKVTILPKEAVSKSIELTPAAMELEEFVVLAPHVEGSIASTIDEKRQDKAVSEVLGAEQMSKSGDSKASDALKRVTGVTIVDGKYVYVRGLGDRYTTVTMNNFYLPSPDPTKRAVPLDIFPTGILDSIKVQKSFTPDKPAEMTGGLVELRTKNIPKAFFMKVGIDAKYVDGVTGKTGNTYKGGAYDWLGYDDGTRKLPLMVRGLTTIDELGSLPDGMRLLASKSMSYDNNVKTTTLQPGAKLSLSMGDKFDINGMDLGIVFAGSYKNENDLTGLQSNVYRDSTTGLQRISGYDHSVTEFERALNGMLGMGLKVNENHVLNWTFSYLHQADDVVSIKEGTNASEPDTMEKKYNLTWTERTLMMSQWYGTHKYEALNDLKLDWKYALSTGEMNEPDRRAYAFQYDDARDQYALTTKTTDRLRREYNELQDDISEAGLDLTLPFEQWDNLDSKFKVGVNRKYQERESNYRTFNYFSSIPPSLIGDLLYGSSIDAIINPNTLGFTADAPFILNELELAVGDYTGEQELRAGYAMVELPLHKKLELVTGARYEKSHQEIRVFNNLTGAEFVDGRSQLKTSDLLPMVGLTYHLAEKMQVRLNYGKTVSRPDFRELSSALLIDPRTGDISQGNPDLQRALIKNYDLRWEWYMSSSESMAFGVFYKDFTKPIETTLSPLTGSELITYENADQGEMRGVEFDIRKNFGEWETRDLSDFYVATNIALIDSEVTTSGKDYITNPVRQMQGQSPYIFNFTLGYDNKDSGTSASILYNVSGERIERVGVNGLPDQYLQPFEQLDFVYLMKLSDKLKFKLKFQNILDPYMEITQGDQFTYRWKKGRSVTTGLEYKF